MTPNDDHFRKLERMYASACSNGTFMPSKIALTSDIGYA